MHLLDHKRVCPWIGYGLQSSMTTFTSKVNALAELLEQQSSKTKNFAELELLILKATQDIGQLAATDLTTDESFPPSQTVLSKVPSTNEQKRNPKSKTKNLMG